MNVDMKK